MLREEYYTPVVFAPAPTVPINQKMIVTINQARAMNASPIPACLRIVNPAEYFLSSPAAVTIWKPPQRRSTKVMSPRMESTQLMALLIILIKLLPWSAPVPPSVIPAVFSAFTPNPPWNVGEVFAIPAFPPKLFAEAIPNTLPKVASPIIITASNFVFIFLYTKNKRIWEDFPLFSV